MRLISWTAACLCALVSLAGLAACGSDSKPSAAGDATSSPASSTASATPSPSVAASPSATASGGASGPCDAITAAQLKRWAGVKGVKGVVLSPSTDAGNVVGCSAKFDYAGSLGVSWTVESGSLKDQMAQSTERHVKLGSELAGEAFVSKAGTEDFMVELGIDGSHHLEVMALDLGLGTPATSKAKLRHLAEQVALAYA